MMKKNGFTLAEVLITLAIIGVVATMTLPALMTNTAEQQAKTGLKKGINTLTEAAQMSQAIDSYAYEAITSKDTSSDTEPSLYALLSKRTQVDYQKSGSVEGGNYAVFFRDGTSLIYNPQQSTDPGAMQSDNLPKGINVILDTNGDKQPNELSNCQGKLKGATSDTTEISACNNKSNRVIKDRFALRLRGNIAVPNGAAARWAFEN